MPLRVLLVEDSEDDALIVLRELKKGGYEPEYERVETAEAMKRALAGSVSWDIVISDYHMPLFEAPEALVVAREAVPETPFVVVSGKIGEEIAVEMMKAGAHDYVMKDNLARLCATVDRGLKEAEERRERRLAEKKLRRRDAILEAVRFAAERFLSKATSWEQSIEEVLERLGVATEASRVYIFENYTGEDGELWSTQRYEWVAPGVSAQMDNPLKQAIPYRAGGYGRWVEILERGDLVYGHTREFPEHEQPELREQEILSIAIVPIFVEGRWWGTIGFDECVEEREWPTIEMGALRAAAGTLGAAIQRRRTEEELRGSEERYRAVIEQATDGIYLLDAGTRRFLESNPAFRKMFGYTADEVRGMEIYDLVAHPRENVDSTIRRTLKERRRIVGERKYRRKDGTLVDVEVGVSVIFYGGREVICTIVRDVTERKRAEEELRGSEELYRAVVEQAAENIFLVDVDTKRILRPNAAFQQLLGYTAEELQQTTLYDVVAHDRESIDRNIQRILTEGRYSVGERRYRRKDGSLVDAEINVSTISYGGRRVLCIVSRDITERKRAEEKLRASEAELRAVFGAMNDVILVLDGDGRYLKVAPTDPSLLYRPPSELLGKMLHDTFPKEQADEFLASVRRALKTRQRVDIEYSLRIGDQRRWFATTISPMLENSVVAVARDITERKKNEEDLKESEERFKGLAEATFEGVAITQDGKIVETNTAFAAMFGYESAEVIGMTPLEVTAPESREAVRKARSSRLEEPYEAVSLRKDGTAFDTEIRGKTSFYKGNTARVTAIRDITERKKSEEALKESERLYRTVIEQAAENICLVDAETKLILESNPAFQGALGYTEEELRLMTLYDIVAHDRESVDANVRRVLEEGHYFLGERKYRHKNGLLVDVEVSASVILYGGEKAFCVVAHDITERARAQELLEERVATLSRIAAGLTLNLPTENTLDVLAESVVNASTAVASLVTLTSEKTGTLHPAGSHGMPEGYTAGLQAAYRAGVQSPTIEAFRTRRPVLVRDLRRFVLNDPLYAPIHHLVRKVPWDILYIVPLISRGRALGAINLCYPPKQEPGEDEKVFFSAVADQTATAVENARLFAEARGKAALEERQRLARELHDSVSQALYGIALGAKTARTLLERDPGDAANPLDYVLSLSEAGLAEMRALIFELRPESLETEGLVAALEKQTAALAARHEIEVEATLCEEPEASLEAKETVYRITQEALHNTVKHARATNVGIKMACDPKRITLEVYDDGLGFDAQSDFPGHLGLRSMRERASSLGGTLEVTSTLGKGTRIRAHIPL